MNPPSFLSKQGQDDESARKVERATSSHLVSSVEQELPSTSIAEKKGTSIDGLSEDRDDDDDSESDTERASPKKKRRSRKAEDVPMSFPQKVNQSRRCLGKVSIRSANMNCYFKKLTDNLVTFRSHFSSRWIQN